MNYLVSFLRRVLQKKPVEHIVLKWDMFQGFSTHCCSFLLKKKAIIYKENVLFIFTGNAYGGLTRILFSTTCCSIYQIYTALVSNVYFCDCSPKPYTTINNVWVYDWLPKPYTALWNVCFCDCSPKPYTVTNTTLVKTSF